MRKHQAHAGRTIPIEDLLAAPDRVAEWAPKPVKQLVRDSGSSVNLSPINGSGNLSTLLLFRPASRSLALSRSIEAAWLPGRLGRRFSHRLSDHLAIEVDAVPPVDLASTRPKLLRSPRDLHSEVRTSVETRTFGSCFDDRPGKHHNIIGRDARYTASRIRPGAAPSAAPQNQPSRMREPSSGWPSRDR